MSLKKVINADEKEENKKELERLFEKYEADIYIETETKESKETLTKILDLEEKFYNRLSKEEQKEFDKISNLKREYEDEINKNIFIYGYKLAMRLMLEGNIK